MELQEKCANCLLHGWTPVEDESKLQLCSNCELIKYCGKDCQSEHWKKVHKKHCKYFKDPTKARPLEHKLDNCYICLNATLMGESQIRRPDNPFYECIFEALKNIPPPHVHPHPFPVTGQPGDTVEKVILILWQLLKKFVLTRPWTVGCEEELGDVFSELMMKRMFLWGFRKVSPLKSEITCITNLGLCDPVNLFDITNFKKIEDSFQLWKIIQLINNILPNMQYSRLLHFLIDPLDDISAEFHGVMSQALSNNGKFLATVNQVLEALATHVIPFQDVLKIICDGNLNQTCRFCSKITNIANVGFPAKGSFVLFNCLYTGIYCCGGSGCRRKSFRFKGDWNRFHSAMVAVWQPRVVFMCDFCFRLPPVKDVYRCECCFTVQYCSQNCLNDDWPIHNLVCKEDMDERKKIGKSDMSKAARDVEELQKKVDQEDIQEAAEMIDGLRFENSQNVDDHTPS